jgi:hypothetical protein
VHTENKENNGKKNKPELSDIKEHAMDNREEEHIYHIHNRIEKEEG